MRTEENIRIEDRITDEYGLWLKQTYISRKADLGQFTRACMIAGMKVALKALCIYMFPVACFILLYRRDGMTAPIYNNLIAEAAAVLTAIIIVRMKLGRFYDIQKHGVRLYRELIRAHLRIRKYRMLMGSEEAKIVMSMKKSHRICIQYVKDGKMKEEVLCCRMRVKNAEQCKVIFYDDYIDISVPAGYLIRKWPENDITTGWMNWSMRNDNIKRKAWRRIYEAIQSFRY